MAQVARGRLLLRDGDSQGAGEAFRVALEHEPDSADVLCLLGISLRRQGETAEALRVLEHAMRIAPTDAAVLANRANALLDDGRLPEAIDGYRLALANDPRHPQLGANLARALRRSGRLIEAVEAYRTLLDHHPGLGEGWTELANTLQVLGQAAAAIAAARRGRELRPQDPRAWVVEGRAFAEGRDFGGALASFDAALARDPRSVEAHVERAACLRAMWRHVEAEASSRNAVRLAPGSAEALLGVGYACMHQGRADDALVFCEQRLADAPSDKEAHHLRSILSCYSGVPDPDLATRSSRVYGGAADADAASLAPLPGERRVRRTLGFVSADFHQHSVAYFLLPLLANLDRDRFEVALYSVGHVDDAMTGRLRGLCSNWADARHDDDGALASRIRADGIEMLVDLSGHTAGTRLGAFARRAAPVQATWLGYPTTTGLAQMDYRITDAVVDPPGGYQRGGERPEHGCERPMRLQSSYFCYGGPAVEVPVSALPAKMQRAVTFGSFNNLAKLSPATLRLWAGVLDAVPGSRFVLRSGDFGDPLGREALLRRFAEAGVARERLVLSGWKAGTQEHLEEYAQVDVALDTYPYNGATTTCEALWMGVPVVSLAGATHASRMGASILGAAGLASLVARSEADYVATAARLAKDLRGLEAMRAGMRERIKGSALMDAPRFARDFEAALLRMAGGAQA